jgi:hypothetical protein
MARASINREGSPLARLTRFFGRGLEFVPTIVLEFRRATAAALRFRELKYTMRGGNGPTGDAARRIYQEFYADL